jgi:ankyrin repeat protein
MAAPNDDDFRRVYEAVAAGESAERLRALIEECARGDDERRKAAVDQLGQIEGKVEMPLKAAQRLDRADLVGVLLEAGAKPGEFEGGGRAAPLYVAIQYGLADTVRFLIKAGHEPNERINYDPGDSPNRRFTIAVHQTILPPPHTAAASNQPPPLPPPRLGCLEILVREAKADVDARNSYGETAMHTIYMASRDRCAALDLLVSLGADVNARDSAAGGDAHLQCSVRGATSTRCGGGSSTAPRVM